MEEVERNSDLLPTFRAGRYCTSDSKYSYKAFIRASQIYGYLVRSQGIAFRVGRKLPTPLIHEDLITYNPKQAKERREALVLLFDALKYEGVYKQILKIKSIFPHENSHHYENLAVILLHDMRERYMMPGICKYQEDAAIIQLENHFNDKRMEIWREISMIMSRNNVRDLDLLIDPKYERLWKFRKSAIFGWTDTRKCQVEAVVKTLKQSGYDARVTIRGLDAVTDTLDVLKVNCGDKALKLLEEPLVCNSVFVIDDFTSCVGPHCFLNILLQTCRDNELGSSLSIESRLANTSGSRKLPVIPEKFRKIDILVADSGNGLTVAHLATLLKSYGFEGMIYAFNAGTKTEVTRCKNLVRRMGIRKVEFYSEKLNDLWILDERFKKAKAAYINPKCSKSAIVNPLSYLTSQDKDFEFLSDIYHDRKPDVSKMVQNQIKVLMFCTMIPQMQVILYTTNSMNDDENNHVIESVIGKEVKLKPMTENDGVGDQDYSDASGLKCESNSPARTSGFQLISIPVNASGFVKPEVEQVVIPPKDGQNGCYFAALSKKL